MGNCAKGEDRAGADDFEPRVQNSSFASAQTNARSSGTPSLVGSIASYTEADKAHISKEIGVDDFRIMKVIGRGSFGKVYMVEKRDNKKIYAMKTLQKDMILRTN